MSASFLRSHVCDVIEFRDDHARMRINDPLASFVRSPSYPESSFPLTSGRKRTTLELSDLKSENSGLPVELRMPKPEINMASSETCPRSLMEKDKV